MRLCSIESFIVYGRSSQLCWISGICFNPYSFCFEGVVGALCCLGYLFKSLLVFWLKEWLMPFVALESLNLGANVQFYFSQQSTEWDQGCPRGSQNRSKGGKPQRFRITGREKDALQNERAVQRAPK